MDLTTATDAQPPSFRVATLNLWGDDTAWEQRLHAVVAAARRMQLDVLMLQESVVGADGSSRAAMVAGALGFEGLAESPTTRRSDGSWLANAVLTRTVLLGVDTVEFDGVDEEGRRRGAVFAWWDTAAGARVLLGSAQLARGGRCEMQRWLQAAALDQAVHTRFVSAGGHVDTVVVGGDWGCGPDADTRRWLAGATADTRDDPTVWTDAWEAADEGAVGATNDWHHPWHQHTLASEGLDGRWGPRPVRQDAVLVAERPWGSTGTPMSAMRCFDQPEVVAGQPVLASNRYGVAARLLG